MEPVNVPSSAQIVNDLSGDLLGDGLDVETVLSVVTRTLSRVRPGTWLAIVMCDDIATSRVVVADDTDQKMAEYINRYMASLRKPGYAPTTGLSQQVIDSGEPVLLPNIPADRFFDHMTPAAREWMVREPAPMQIHSGGVVMVPMRANGRIVGTLALIQWNSPGSIGEDDVLWMQPIADRIGLAVDDAQNRTSSVVRLERLSALHRVALALSSSQDLRLTLPIVVEQVAATLPADAVDLLVLEDATQEFRVATAAGFHSTSIPDYRLPAAPILAELAALGGRPGLITGAEYVGRTQPCSSGASSSASWRFSIGPSWSRILSRSTFLMRWVSTPRSRSTTPKCRIASTAPSGPNVRSRNRRRIWARWTGGSWQWSAKGRPTPRWRTRFT